jgi:DNA-binding CsgD family transcriptional regulator
MRQIHAPEAHAITGGSPAVLVGDIDTGLALAQARFERAQADRNPGVIQGHGYVMALARALKGDLATLDEVVSFVMTITSVATIQEHFRSGIAGLAAARTRWTCGPPPAASERWCGPFPYMGGFGGTEEATDTPWAAAVASAERGYVAAAAFAAADAADVSRDTAALARVLPLLQGAESPLIKAVTGYAKAVVERDGPGLAAIAETFEALGAGLFVARARVQQVLWLRERGDLPAAAQLAETAWVRADPVRRAAGGLFAPLARAIELTAREVEVAALVVDGWATGDVATKLVLSVRTVEHHLFNAYRRIGVTSRDELRRAFATWLRSVKPVLDG